MLVGLERLLARRPGRAQIFVASVVIAVVLVQWGSGRVVLTHAPMDVFYALEEAMRLSAGERPHLDFTTPLGPVHHLLVRLSSLVFGDHPLGALGVAILPAMVLAVCFLPSLTRRLGGLFGTLVSLMLFSLAVAPTSLDFSPFVLSHFGLYNRLSWQALGILCVVLLVRPFGARGPNGPEILACAGLAVALVLLKPTHGLALGVLGAAALVLHNGPTRARLVSAATLLCALALLVFAREIVGLLGSLEALLPAREGRAALKATAMLSIGLLDFVVALLACLVAALGRDRDRLVCVLGIVLAGYLVVYFGHESRMPFVGLVLGLAGIGIVARGRRGLPAGRRLIGQVPGMVLCLSVFVSGLTASIAHGSIGFLAREETTMAHAHPGFSGFVVTSPHVLSALWFEAAGGAMKAVAADGGAQASILALDFANPFPFLGGALGSRAGVPIWLDDGFTIARAAHPSAQALLGSADYVVRFRGPVETDRVALLWELYGETIERDFVVIAHESLFVVFARPRRP